MSDRKKIGVRRTSNGAAGVGKIREIRMGQAWNDSPDDGSACVTVQFGETRKPKLDKHGAAIGPYHSPKRSELYVPAAAARRLRIGQKVRVTLEPA